MMALRGLLASARRRPRLLVAVTATLLAGTGLLAVGTARRRAGSRAASADPETGLRPRGEFDRLLALLLQTGRRSTPPVSVILVGLRGPPRTRLDAVAWESAIRAVGASVAAAAPDRAYRLGSSELALLLPRTDAADAAALASDVADRARVALAGVSRDPADDLRASVRWATAGDDATTPDQLLRRAEERAVVAPARQ